ncbi:hypothetical protein C0991_012162 [Blastosporella zonata]|nr:hypothetical protein C0991_012162 [Blastosporella zonata]
MLLRRLASTLASSSTKPGSFRLPPTIKQLLASTKPDDQLVTVSGWIKSIRRQKNVSFAVLTDGSSSHGLQAVFLGNGEGVKALTNGAAVQLTGKLVASPGAGQEKELVIESGKNTGSNEEIQILGVCDPELYPIQKQALSIEYLRDHSHLRARTDAIAAMVRLRDDLKKKIDTFFNDQGFVYSHTPILTGNDAEGGGEAFKIASIPNHHPGAEGSSGAQTTEFFSRPAHLTVSHQLHLEALATSLSRVYTLSPCFRAEPSLTGRHLAEFWMLEAEWAFGGRGSVLETCEFVEACLRSVVGSTVNGVDADVLWKGANEEGRKALTDAVGASSAWGRMTYTEAIKALEDHQRAVPGAFHYEPGWGRALQSEHERWIAETLVKGPVFITDYPAELKPFYMRENADGKTVGCFDLIVPHVGELVGGSVREERTEILKRKMEEGLGQDLTEYSWYLDLRRYGGAPHMGFGMGFERLVGWVGGIDNVRETRKLSSKTTFTVQARLKSTSPYGRTHVWKRRPAELPNPIVPKFPQLVIRSDGSSFTHWTTSPKSMIRLTRDTTNNPVWNTGTWSDARGVEEESSMTGRLGRFNRKFDDLGKDESSGDWMDQLVASGVGSGGEIWTGPANKKKEKK